MKQKMHPQRCIFCFDTLPNPMSIIHICNYDKAISLLIHIKRRMILRFLADNRP